MRRAILLLLVLALAAGGAYWLSGQEHDVELTAGAWTARAPAPVAGGIAIAALMLAAFVALLLRWVIAAPGRVAAWTAMRQRNRGDRAIEDALAALAAGDIGAARRATMLARDKLGDRALTLWLDSRAALAAGDDTAAQAALKKLAATPRGALPGLRGLASRAALAGQTEEARRLLADATRGARAPALAEAELDLALRARDWAAALVFARAQNISGRRRAEITLAAARAMPEGDGRMALLREAAKADPAFAPASADYASALLARGETRRARRTLLEAWRAGPHPMLAEVVLRPRPGEDSKAVVLRVDDLASEVPGAAGHVLRARALLNAGQWTKARKQISAAREAGADTRGIHLMLADLAEAEPATDDAARDAAREAGREHLRDAAMAAPDPAWRCRVCATSYESWVPACNVCDTALSLDWVAGGALPPKPLPALAIAAPEA